MEPYKLVAVSYLNTKPLIFGLVNSPLAEQIDIDLDIPSACANKLLSGKADIGLVPVAAIPALGPEVQVISDFGIGSEGSVATVGIFSEVP